MNIMVIVYSLNGMLIILHEIESAFEKEWELLNLPGKIGGFLVVHIPIVLLMFYGLIELARNSLAGMVVALVLGIGGLMPFLVHEVLVKRKDRFTRVSSRILIYTNAASALLLVILSIKRLV